MIDIREFIRREIYPTAGGDRGPKLYEVFLEAKAPLQTEALILAIYPLATRDPKLWGECLRSLVARERTAAQKIAPWLSLFEYERRTHSWELFVIRESALHDPTFKRLIGYDTKWLGYI